LKIKIHQIEFDASDPVYPEVTFRGGYRPGAGPLPTLHYPLTNLWVRDGVVVKAFFEATRLPVHEGEPILHRYESATATHQGQGSYRYFTIPGFAGMMLSPAGFAANGVRLIEVFHHLDEEVNEEKLTAWLDTLTPERRSELRIEYIADEFNQYAPVIVVIDEAPEPEPPTEKTKVVLQVRDPNTGFTGNPDIDDDIPF
jgi:hypothetical protein